MTMRKFAVVAGARAPRAGEGPRLKVAFASMDGRGLNAHFGSARKFMLYEVAAHDSRLLGVVDFSDTSDESGEHGAASENRIAAKISSLAGCQLLFVLAIGGPVAAKVVKANIHPIKVVAAEPIAQSIHRIQELMRGEPPPWMRKILEPKRARSMNFLDEED